MASLFVRKSFDLFKLKKKSDKILFKLTLTHTHSSITSK